MLHRLSQWDFVLFSIVHLQAVVPFLMVALARMNSRIVQLVLRTFVSFSSKELETRRCSIESTVVAHEYEHEEKLKMTPRGRDANACTCCRRKSS